jgi:hypothetical protein
MSDSYLPEVDILAASPPPPEPSSAAAAVLGTWKLVSVTREDVATAEKTDFFGADPHGYIHYGGDGRMMVVIVRTGRPKPTGTDLTADQAQALMKSVVSYAGTWEIRGNEMTHFVDISWNESWSGTAQKRLFRFVGDKLHLDTPPSPDPVDGRHSVRSMVWERMK